MRYSTIESDFTELLSGLFVVMGFFLILVLFSHMWNIVHLDSSSNSVEVIELNLILKSRELNMNWNVLLTLICEYSIKHGHVYVHLLLLFTYIFNCN